jgi:hypothetical protein
MKPEMLQVATKALAEGHSVELERLASDKWEMKIAQKEKPKSST